MNTKKGWTTDYVNKAVLQQQVSDLIGELVQRFEYVLRRGDEPWRVDDAFMMRIAQGLDGFAERLAQMTIERSQAQCKSKEEYVVIPQDVLDAYDIIKSTNKG